MPAKKKVAKRKVAKKKKKPVKCDEKKLCAYLDKLYVYLNVDQPGTLHHYLKTMSDALCNVEDQAFGPGGNPAARWCGGGGAGGPVPPKPPVW